MKKKSAALSSGGAAIESMIELVGFRMGTATVSFHAAVAERLGMSMTDVKCYSILRQAGPMTAGDLAARVSLTTGAITGVIDRLDKKGLVQRRPDPNDRRRVVVELVPNPERERAIAGLYAPMGSAITRLVTSYSQSERATLVDFITKATEILESETAALRNGAEGKSEL